ncbi:predicted protein [Naegleria gruberi]|uniref:Predicted protein n=1 Tax=Naegleria gruberi TaxID=5762 RepID=D2VXG4_NAEGR|nr:uncharacterized protein NAEGRDRAFT_73738 [Naegleria gruberi]EFC38503.1 predicted protein [Naegleria gruberi]|eukprot:XP_002671247.1 predicted protein [Naegleria gruberi strain NEG-M]
MRRIGEGLRNNIGKCFLRVKELNLNGFFMMDSNLLKDITNQLHDLKEIHLKDCLRVKELDHAHKYEKIHIDIEQVSLRSYLSQHLKDNNQSFDQIVNIDGGFSIIVDSISRNGAKTPIRFKTNKVSQLYTVGELRNLLNIERPFPDTSKMVAFGRLLDDKERLMNYGFVRDSKIIVITF